jgi:hypothetical protein
MIPPGLLPSISLSSSRVFLAYVAATYRARFVLGFSLKSNDLTVFDKVKHVSRGWSHDCGLHAGFLWIDQAGINRQYELRSPLLAFPTVQRIILKIL